MVKKKRPKRNFTSGKAVNTQRVTLIGRHVKRTRKKGGLIKGYLAGYPVNSDGKVNYK